MDNLFADDAVDGNESHPKYRGPTTLLEEPSLIPGKEDATICTSCQAWADILAKYILDYDGKGSDILFLPILSIVQSAKVECPFCVFMLETIQLPLWDFSHRPNIPETPVCSILQQAGNSNCIVTLYLYFKSELKDRCRIEVATEEGIYSTVLLLNCR
jgi:hypothetical protein